MLQKIAHVIRSLVMDAVEHAGSGHPGLPMGCAELGAFLYGEFLHYHPQNPNWIERDRVILSAGHGSLWLYTCMHLAGFAISIEDIKQFRQIHSITPSHPDRTKTVGIEATTGLDGQGVGYGVGQALALKIASLDSKVVILAGDGCLMEGISYEACSLAGHLRLNNLILIYDCNKTTLDGYVNESFSECVELRFRAQGWNVCEIDGHDFNAMRATITPLRFCQEKPTLVIAHTEIGRGAPNKGGTPLAHGAPLGKEEVKLAKTSLNLPDIPFYVPSDIYTFFSRQQHKEIGSSKKIRVLETVNGFGFRRFLENFWPIFRSIPGGNIRNVDITPRNGAKNWFKKSHKSTETKSVNSLLSGIEQAIKSITFSKPLAGRWASHTVLQEIAKYIPDLVVGSADLSSSDGTFILDSPWIHADDFTGRNIKYGVREFAMGALAAGMAQTELLLPVIGTFLVFSDYMKSAIRMICLMKLKVIFHLTHDSFLIGQDGPTHQPLEQIANLRTLPGFLVLRPADPHEVKMCWIAALKHDGPAALILSRQELPLLMETTYEEGVGRGAYIIRKEEGEEPDYLFLATGSEVHLALAVADELGPMCRVVSVPSQELFNQQDLSYQRSVLQGKTKISIEAGVEQGWHKYIGAEGIAISLSSFGESGLISDLAERFGFTKKKILSLIHQNRPNPSVVGSV